MGLKSLSEFQTTWKKVAQCTKCGNVRPSFLFSQKRSVCDLCERHRRNKNNRSSRRARRDEVRAYERQRYHDTPVPLRRCRNSYYKIRGRAPQNVPFWSTMESVLPIYEYAHELDLSTGPEFRHNVCHIYPLRGKEVCGLHTLKNLRIVRSKIPRSPIAPKNSAKNNLSSSTPSPPRRS